MNKQSRNELKMSLLELRNSINLDKKNWKHIFTTNCYAYALGLDVREQNIKDFAYIPGVISGVYKRIDEDYSIAYPKLLDNIHDDLEFLGINFREVNPLEEISNDEWKIAIFTSFLACDFFTEIVSDFHFLRQRENGIWYHKEGWFKRPTNKDSNSNIITDPSDCYLRGRQYKKCYSLKLNK